MPAKEFLKQNEIEYIEKNVSEDKAARKEMMSYKLMSVPSFVVDGEAFVGVDEEKLLAAK